MTLTRLETGLVDGDQRTHVAIPKLNGPVAMCGAGKIVQRVPGFFDPADPKSCQGCVEALP